MYSRQTWPSGAALAFTAMLLARTAHAEDKTVVDRSSTTSTEPGVSLGVRPGLAVPLGRAASGADGFALSDTMAVTLPVWVDLGYRINANVYVGIWGQLGLGLPRGCPTASCFATNLRFGPNVHFRFRPRAALDPWVGAGAGYDILTLATPDANRLGPYVGYAVGMYTQQSIETGGSRTDQSIGSTAAHHWLTFGLRGAIDL